MNDIEQKPLDNIKALFSEMATQHSESTNSLMKESKLKTGLMLLYFWAIAHRKEDIKKKLQEEASELFNSVGNFFVQVEIDYENLTIERPDIISDLIDLNEDDYNHLISFFQKEYKDEAVK